LHGKSGKEDDQETEDGLSDEKAFIYQFDEKTPKSNRSILILNCRLV
jgi:hypothetical protein